MRLRIGHLFFVAISWRLISSIAPLNVASVARDLISSPFEIYTAFTLEIIFSYPACLRLLQPKILNTSFKSTHGRVVVVSADAGCRLVQSSFLKNCCVDLPKYRFLLVVDSSATG